MIKCLTFCLAFRRPRFLVCEDFIGDEAFLFFPLGSASEVKVWLVGIMTSFLILPRRTSTIAIILYCTYVTAAGSLSPETSAIPVNSSGRVCKGKLWQLNVNRILLFIGWARLASPKGSGYCSCVPSITLASASVS